MKLTNPVIGLAVALTATMMSSHAAFAQYNFTGGLRFNAGFPQGEFRSRINGDAYGIAGQFFHSPNRSPFAIGVELGYMNYGNESRRERFSTTIPDVTVRVETSNNILDGFLIFRGQVPDGQIRPYVDALLGFNYLFTETEISGSDNPSESIASSTNADDAVFAYGFGGGVVVKTYEGGSEDGGDKFQVLLDGGLRYILGGEAEYLKEGSIRREDGIAKYDLIRSRTDLLLLHVGVAVRF